MAKFNEQEVEVIIDKMSEYKAQEVRNENPVIVGIFPYNDQNYFVQCATELRSLFPNEKRYKIYETERIPTDFQLKDLEVAEKPPKVIIIVVE